MKQFYFLMALAIILGSSTLQAQEVNSPWYFEVGINAVDVYPVGEDTPQGDYFDEFLNLNDHWNFGMYVGVSRTFTQRWSVSAKGSFNTISKWGEFGETDESVLVDNLKYYSLDGMINFNILKDAKLTPYISVGGGYTWIEEGPYNTFSTKDGVSNLVGAGTVNGALGLTYQITNNFGVKLQTTYKHAFKEYLVKHWQHTLGITYTLGSKTAKPEKEKPLDADADGIPDAYDLCPETFGLQEYGGCPDTDKDGVPDNLDACPNVKGTDMGCPAKTVAITEPAMSLNTESNTSKTISKAIYFDIESAQLDNNAKVVLDLLLGESQSTSQYSILIAGHADNTGSIAFNNKLSLQRAEQVKKYLVSKGVSQGAISVSHDGLNKPVANNSTKEGRALNRRAELTILITAN